MSSNSLLSIVKYFNLTLIIIFLSFFTKLAFAIVDPLSRPNNQFGIHIIDENDLNNAATLVNSNGGDWGYVTLVIPDTDFKLSKWKDIFIRLRKLHLIPLVRLATHVENGAWAIPKKGDAFRWTEFLSQMPWPVMNRYVILFNEPNHAGEWGNTIDPEGYSETLKEFSDSLRKASDSFFILPAGLDMSAHSGGNTLDGAEFLRRMHARTPTLFSSIDGWNSHSYPNPGFSASVLGRGKGSIGSFLYEQQLIRQYTQQKLPLFITETGWMHSNGKYFDSNLLSPEQVSENLRTAAATLWTRENVVTVTPFLLNYQDAPFDHFSFQKIGNSEFYPHYYAYKDISKIAGSPARFYRFEVSDRIFPHEIVVGSTFEREVKLKNIGDAELDPKDSFSIAVSGGDANTQILGEIPYLDPGEQKSLIYTIHAPEKAGEYLIKSYLHHAGEEYLIDAGKVIVIPPPSVNISVSLGWRRAPSEKNITVLLYSKNHVLLSKYENISIEHGSLKVSSIKDIVPGEEYRVVVLVPYYLPRQAIVKFTGGITHISMKRHFPFDFNGDGKLSFRDIPALLQEKPHTIIGRFVGTN